MRTLAAELEEQGTSVTLDTVWRFVRRQGLTLKKPADFDQTGSACCRRFRRRQRAHQYRIDPNRLVFLDETWIRTDITRLTGLRQRGVPLLASNSHVRWPTLTFIAGLRGTDIMALCVFDGPINGDLFTAGVEHSLAPT